MGPTTVVWSRICNTGRVLGVIWVFERDMDTCSHYQLESDLTLELRLHSDRVCGERCIFGPELMARCECHGRKNQ